MLDKTKLLKLQQLLKEEEQRNNRNRNKHNIQNDPDDTHPQSHHDPKKTFQRALQQFGVLPLDEHKHEHDNQHGADHAELSIWNRGVTSSMFSIPLCAPPVTTLVPKSSLSKSFRRSPSDGQAHILKSVKVRTPVENNDISHDGTNDDDDDDENVLVEVPIAALMPDATSSSASGSGEHVGSSTGGSSNRALPSQRPLNGNLSSKLVEYTRGQVGKRQPFQPGGMQELEMDIDMPKQNRDQVPEQNQEYPLYCSPQEIENAFQVLKKGAREAWNDGTLITAPPGASYKVGLTFDHVYQNRGDSDDIDGDVLMDASADTDVSLQQDVVDSSPLKDADMASANANANTQAVVVSKMWDESYFEDDSLFGDDESSVSSASSSSSSGSDDSNGVAGDGKEKEEENSESDEDESAEGALREIGEDSKQEDGDNDDDIHDIDALLSELTVSATATKVEQSMLQHKKQSAAISIQNNPSTTTSALTQTKKNPHNPLHIAEKRQPTKDRKSWAVTTSLNLADFHSVVPNPAITHPFELDTFQKQAVARLERGECIFVAAHTSAGKTVCAEYAIALARKHCTRAIYTSPIKALSNQKYRDFQDTFGDDVGLITGDLQINADSSCLIMTTEILRSMLYRGADLIRDIEWVIFDEVHYINDTERGVVWEEVIIMLPDYVNMIFLSATTPNTNEFSDWIGRTKKKPVHVIRTDYRPVPLSHHLFAGRKLHKIKEGNGGFIEKGYKEAALSLLPASERNKKDQKGGGTNNKTKGGGGGGSSKPGQKKTVPTRNVSGSSHSAWQQSGGRQDWTALVKFLDREGLMPAVIFSFSKKKCEEIANMLRSLDLNTAAERSAAHAFAIQTMKRLSPKDASLPQVITTCEMVKRGIGVHHGGLLPILKEMVEILFSRNLIKVLFATETFAMGVNMPARAVVFNSIRKHDGTRFRVLEPGEYTQMAGRAGRRGLDKVGTVIMCCFGEEPPPQFILRNMLLGSSTRLSSQFRLTYNMILNLLRVEDMTVEGMIKRSFSEFATQRALATNEYPKLLKRGTKALVKLNEEFTRDVDTRIGAEDISDYYSASSELLSLNKEALVYLLGLTGGNGGGAFVPGRIILVTAARKKGWARSPAIVLKAPQVASNGSITKPAVCIVLLPESHNQSMEKDKTSNSKEFHLNYVGSYKNRNYIYAYVEPGEILFLSAIKHKIDSDKIFKEDSSGSGLKTKGLSTKSSKGGSFFSSKPVARKVDDFGFGNMKARGKTSTPGTNSRSEEHLLENVIDYLLEAESLEANADLGILQLRDCVKGIGSHGDDMLRFGTTCDHTSNLIMEVRSYKSHLHRNLEKHYTTVEKKETLRDTIQALQRLLSNESLQLFPDFLQRKSLLKTLNYIDENDTVKVKGRVACECNTCEELIVTELVFEGVLNDLEPPEIVAALSALIFQEKSDSELDSELPERLRTTCEAMKRIALNLGQLQNEHGLMIDPKDYAEASLKFGLVHVVYEWALGVPFSSICQLTLVQEGSIVRCITRLDELCREVRNCARVVGNPTLYRKMEEASVAIKRDIVFASSLYIS